MTMTCFSHSHNNNEFGPSFSDACTMSQETLWIILSQHPIFCYVYRSSHLASGLRWPSNIIAIVYARSHCCGGSSLWDARHLVAAPARSIERFTLQFVQCTVLWGSFKVLSVWFVL